VLNGSKPKVLFCIGCGGDFGMGHLSRAGALIEAGRGRFDPLICVLRGSQCGPIPQFGDCIRVSAPEDEDGIDLIVSDMRDTSRRLMARLSRIAPVVSLDDRGRGSRFAHVTVYTLPGEGGDPPNVYGREYMVLNPAIRKYAGHRKEPHDVDGPVLVSFGGSDPGNLSQYMVSVLNKIGIEPVVVRGPFYRNSPPSGKCRVVHAPDDFYDLLFRARVLITSFGITMYEAFYLGTPVVLFNHSKYHCRLSGNVDAPNLGYVGSPVPDIEDRLGAAINGGDIYARARENLKHTDGLGADRVLELIERALSGMRTRCLFNHGVAKAVVRKRSLSLMRCSRCGDLFLFELEEKKDIYTDAYFLEEYESQYGKTYEGDRENIRRFALRRLDVIERIAGPGKKSLLDIGCALGFFLEAARERGWDTLGVEISPFASEWARSNLGLDVITGGFLQADLPEEHFDVATLFFVSEHFKHVEKVIERVYRVLKKGGLLVLSLPNRGGADFRTDFSGWVERHPDDHYFDTNVRHLVRYLRGRGFKKKKIVATGIHPERFFGRSRLGCSRVGERKLFAPLYTVAAGILKVGDTFEYYGFKV